VQQRRGSPDGGLLRSASSRRHPTVPSPGSGARDYEERPKNHQPQARAVPGRMAPHGRDCDVTGELAALETDGVCEDLRAVHLFSFLRATD
jgi:hypothetical protein